MAASSEMINYRERVAARIPIDFYNSQTETPITEVNVHFLDPLDQYTGCPKHFFKNARKLTMKNAIVCLGIKIKTLVFTHFSKLLRLSQHLKFYRIAFQRAGVNRPSSQCCPSSPLRASFRKKLRSNPSAHLPVIKTYNSWHRSPPLRRSFWPARNPCLIFRPLLPLALRQRLHLHLPTTHPPPRMASCIFHTLYRNYFIALPWISAAPG